MPSKKPVVQFHCEQWMIDELKRIAEEENRSLANLVRTLCLNHVLWEHLPFRLDGEKREGLPSSTQIKDPK